jgi:glycosyltransferase involved in cell wall biosynthesis
VDYHHPWDIGFEDRMAMLTRGSPRAAYFFEKPDTSTFRYRVFNVSQALAEGTPGGPSSAWFDQDEFDRMDRVIDLCDLLVVCRARYTHRVANMIERAKTRGRRVIFDCDDLVFDLSHTHMIMDTLGQALEAGHVWDQWFANIGRVAATFALCDGAVVTNPYLAQRARDAFADDRPIRILPNFLEPRQQALSADIWQAKAESGWSRDDTVHLGYFSGTPTHNRDFALIAGVIARIMDDDPRLRLRIVGFLDLGPELARHTTRIEFLPLQDYLNLQRLIGEVEVNLVPLQDNMFTNCKSELKWFEAAVVGTLTIATPTYTFRHAIEHGQTGWLAASQNWESVLREVVRDIDGHADITWRARESALARHGWNNQRLVITDALFA